LDLDVSTKHLSVFYDVLDKFYPEWEKRADDYFLTELSFLIREVFKSPYTDETLINNLKQSEVRKYQAELKAILNTPKEALDWILKHRMSENRRKMCETKYLKRGNNGKNNR
jgi:hypothetical protein